MGHMKNFDLRIRNGGDDAIAAVGELTAHLEGEIERLRERNEAASSTGAGTCERVNLATANEFHAEIARLRLTDAERQAVKAAAQILRDHDAGDCEMYAALRGLLERLR